MTTSSPEFYLQKYFADFLFEIFNPNGKKLIKSQVVKLNYSYGTVACCYLDANKYPTFEFSFGLAFNLAKICINYVEILYEEKSKQKVESPFRLIEPLIYKNDISSEEDVLRLTQTLEKILLKFKESELYHIWHFLFENSLSFIIYHEYGHFISGHIHYRTSYVLKSNMSQNDNNAILENYASELYADIIATQWLTNHNLITIKNESTNKLVFQKYGDENWFRNTTHSIFIVFVLMELLNNKESKTHPEANLRIINSLKHIVSSYYIHNLKDNFLEALKLCINTFKEIKKASNFFNLELSNWESHILSFFNTTSNEIRNSKSSLFQLTEIQIFSNQFRYKIGRYACSAITDINENDNTIFLAKLIALSGNHFPWDVINTNKFLDIAINRIDFSDERVISEILDSKHSNLVFNNNIKDFIVEQIKTKNMEFKKIKPEIEVIDKLSIDELYEKIGTLVNNSHSIMGFTDNEKDSMSELETGKFWVQQNKELLKKKVCNSNVYSVYFNGEKKYENTLLYAAIADLISGICLGFSPIVVAVLIVKQGLDKFCQTKIEIKGE